MLDVVLEDQNFIDVLDKEDCFNPCCAGCSSGSRIISCTFAFPSLVSILVVLDVVLEVFASSGNRVEDQVFQSLLCWM